MSGDGFPKLEPFAAFPLEDSERIYDSPWCGLRRDQLRLESGALQEYHVIEISPAVCVVPVMKDGSIAMIWQHRHPHGGTHWEVPAGRLHENEPPADGALRELAEETGLVAERIVRLAGFYPTNGISAHYAHVFAALECEVGADCALDAAERLTMHVIPRAAVHERLTRGGFEDGFTTIALFYYFAHEGRDAVR